MPKRQKLNESFRSGKSAPALERMRKRVALQAAMAVTAVGLTVVMLFAMTAAWYTNIVHTSGLTFEVEPWGFDGVVSSDMKSIIAGPGDEGLIDLEVTSYSDSPAAVSVTVSKDAMAVQTTVAEVEEETINLGQEMQKRLYFYVDTQMVRNGETMNRVYLNSRESYTYNLFSRGKLTLTEAVHNAPQLKWHWVYDVLGYYVQGVKLADGTIGVEEYLRPIEYDYDAATLTYNNETGTYNIATVDGKLTPKEFLVELSKTDGFAGTIDPNKTGVTTDGYYPIAVDEKTGNGVYAYLCSYAEIEQSIAKDTLIAEKYAENTTYTAKLLVSAQKSKNTVVNVNTLAGLTSAIKLGAADTVQLSSNMTLGEGEQLTIQSGQRVMLDLNGKTITVTDASTVPVVVEEGGSLTMTNGTIAYSGTGTKPTAIQSTGAEIVLNDVDLTGFYRGMKITDNSAGTDAQGLDSTVRLVGCEWKTTDCTLMVYGNGISSEQKTQVIIEDSTLTSDAITITGGGNDDSYGTDIQILNSTITSNPNKAYSGIYHPQRDSVLTIYNSTVSGYTGMAIKGGTVNIHGSDIYGYGTGLETIPSFSLSGFNDTGDAVYVETNYGYPIEVNVGNLITTKDETTETDESRLSSTYWYGLRVYDAGAYNVEVNLTGGIYQKVQNLDRFQTYFDNELYELKDNSGSGYSIVAKSTSTGE